MRRILLIVFGSLFILAGVTLPIKILLITLLFPNSFSSTARVYVGVSGQGALVTEIEKIRSRAILLPVVTNLSLTSKWAEKYHEEKPLHVEHALALLRRQLRVEPARGTLLLKITIKSEDPVEAPSIANAIASSYISSPLSPRAPDGNLEAKILDQAQMLLGRIAALRIFSSDAV